MKVKYILLLSALAGLLIGLSGCIKEFDPESDIITEKQLQASPDAVERLVKAIPTKLVSYINDNAGIELVSYNSITCMLEHMTTDMVICGYFGFNTMSVYTYGNLTATGSNRGIYPFYYYYGIIKACNDVLALIDPNTEDETLKQYIGIAKAYRAMLYMELSAIYEYKKPTDPRYADLYVAPETDITNLTVPIVTESTSSQSSKNNPRATFDKMYEFILEDLKDAEDKLEGFKPSNKTFPSLAVVYGLYARAYMDIASHNDDDASYTEAANYAQKAIDESGCTFLTEEQWTDPKTGFNSMSSQNSWLWATSIAESNTSSQNSGFNFTMTMGTETTFSSYGWRVGRAINRKTYERIADNDFRKLSWLAPEFFAKSFSYDENNPTESGRFGRYEKWASQEEFDTYYTGPEYKLNCEQKWLADRLYGGGWESLPWSYPNIKFRPKAGNYNNRVPGCATDAPIMRVEEMHFIIAEAKAQIGDIGGAKEKLTSIMSNRIDTSKGDAYSCDASDKESVLEEIMFQKRVELWGEGRNYFDAKRLGLGLHRGYEGLNQGRYQGSYDIDGIAPFWTIPFPSAELEGNPTLESTNNPMPYNVNMFYFGDNDFYKYFGKPLD